MPRKFAYNEQGEPQPIVVSEDYIKEHYYPHWVERMHDRKARGRPDIRDADINWENCLDEWIVVNWAWEVTDDQ